MCPDIAVWSFSQRTTCLFEHHWNTALGWYNSDAAISLGSGDCQETSVPGNSSKDSAATQNEKRHPRGFRRHEE
jgi:hypothetical protein